MNYRLQSYTDPATLTTELGNTMTAILKKALATRATASVVVSGGRTPKDLFNYLSAQDLAWERVIITLADERCCPANLNASNARLIHTELLKNKAKPAGFIPLYYAELSLEQSLFRANRDLQELDTEYDIVILGMGEDGHTASIFPAANNLEDLLAAKSTAACLATDPVSVTPKRISQTKNKLLHTQHLILHITGTKKLDVFQQAAATKTDSLPISHFIHQNKVLLNVFHHP